MLRTSVSDTMQLVHMFRCYTDSLVVVLRKIVVYHCEQGYVQHACAIGQGKGFSFAQLCACSSEVG